MRTLLLAFGLACSPAAASAGDAPEARPQAVQREEAASIADRLSTGLFFRGELADKILEAGIAGRFVSLDGVETNAGARSALLAWIKKNPAGAAEVFLSLKGGGRVHDRIETREMSWEFNPSFIAAVNALRAAAGSSSVSNEALELASRRLYEGPQSGAEGPEVRAGSGKRGGTGFFSDYADYRLNRAGLEKELSQAGGWLEGARGEAKRLKVEGAYAAAFAGYSEFIVAASALKGRGAVTEAESRGLETLRARLRSALAALSLRTRAAALAEAGSSLAKAGPEPGARELLASVAREEAGLEALAARAGAGGLGLAELGRLVNSAEKGFAALYLGFSAYDGLLGLKRRAGSAGFSCLYDYAVYRCLAAFFPGAGYPRARAELAAAVVGLDSALLKAGSGDLSGALGELRGGRVEAAEKAVRSASSFNRAVQFFSWGLLLRPVELKVSARNGRALFRPAITFFEVLRPAFRSVAKSGGLPWGPG